MTWRSFLTPAGRDVVFDLVVHLAWADGRLTPIEIVATQGAASALGLALGDLGTALLARRSRSLEQIDLVGLGPLQRPLAYGAAVWMSIADGRMATTEHHALRHIRRALQLGEPLATRIDAWAWGLHRGAIHAGEHALELDALLGRIARHLLGDEPLEAQPIPWPEGPRAPRLRRG
jgi:hypothetical protein